MLKLWLALFAFWCPSLLANEWKGCRVFEGMSRDNMVRDLILRVGIQPATYFTGGTYGSVPKNTPLFRGVAGPDHTLESVFGFMAGDLQHELVSPSFKFEILSYSQLKSLQDAYSAATTAVFSEIGAMIRQSGLKDFAFYATANSSTGLPANRKKGPILKFTNQINSALRYSASSFERNLGFGQRVIPFVFDASNHGDLVLGETRPAKPQHYNEYDFLSNVAIRHINAIYVGLTESQSSTVYEMQWLKITPTRRNVDGSFQAIAVEFVEISQKNPIEIMEETGKYPDYELTNLVPRKFVGKFERGGQFELSSSLNSTERGVLKSFIQQTKNW